MRPPRALLLFGLVGSVALAASLSACGAEDAPAGFPAQPYVTLSSTAHALSVAVRTSPQPPTRGDQDVELTITDADSGAPRTGLTLAVEPWMPVMDHGASVVPTVTETAPGTYVVANVDMYMAGEWALMTTIHGPSGEAGAGAGASSDYVSPTFQIP